VTEATFTPGTPMPIMGRILPVSLYGSGRARRMFQRNVTVYARGWMYFVSGFFEPFFYLLSIGIGLSHLVHSIPVAGNRVPYASFVAPGLMATSAMNGAVIDSTYNVFFKLKITKSYDAVLSTPMMVGDIVRGELSWAMARGAIYGAAFLCVMAGLGYVDSPWAFLCYPSAMLLAFAFAATGMAVTTYMRTWSDLDMVSLALVPFFLFSSTFFPLTVFPGALQLVVRFTPLYQGVAMLRGFDLGLFNWALLGHTVYLLTMGLTGLAIASRRMAKLLLP
jgi:lipooligosaccharide transport system permease protein